LILTNEEDFKMTVVYDNAVPIQNLGFLYINGGIVSNDATTPNTILNVSACQCRDSSNTSTANSVTKINAANVGLNGIDTGALAASTVYFVYVVADPVSGNLTGCIISTSAPSTGPIIPYGYSAVRHIGYAITDASSHFLLAYSNGNNNARTLTFDAPQATAVTAGNATAATAVDLTKWVPTLPINIPVHISYSYVPATAGNAFSMQPVNGTGFPVVITGQVATVHVSGVNTVLAQIVAAGTKPEINYKVGNASDAVAINVGGFDFFIY
jgi:hypothetical protein